MIERWLIQPHVGEWWGDPHSEIALMDRDIENENVHLLVVELLGRPFAYMQDYAIDAWPMPQYGDLPRGTRAIDTFLGDPAYKGQGHVSGYLDKRVRQLRERFPMVAADPSPKNLTAVQAYSKAGFHNRRLAPRKDGNLVQVMTRL